MGGAPDDRRPDWEDADMDLVSLGLVAVFFALSWGFVVLCERLLG